MVLSIGHIRFVSVRFHISDDEIRACGRWSEVSFIFKRYIRIPVKALIRLNYILVFVYMFYAFNFILRFCRSSF